MESNPSEEVTFPRLEGSPKRIGSSRKALDTNYPIQSHEKYSRHDGVFFPRLPYEISSRHDGVFIPRLPYEISSRHDGVFFPRLSYEPLARVFLFSRIGLNGVAANGYAGGAK